MTELIDILPTVMEMCGQPVDETLMGQSIAADLLAGTEPKGRSDALTFSHDLDGPHALLTTPTHKYIHSGGREQLWEWHCDAAEGCDLSGQQPELTGQLRQRLLERMLAAGKSYRVHPNLF
jgi:arylsulfatase A-like enzyme